MNLACCLLLLAGYAPSGYSAGLLAPDDAEVVSRGAQLYATHCASCHGKDLQGQADWRKRGKDQRLPAPPHDASGHTWHHSEALLFKMTKYGPSALVQGGYPSNMPGFEKILTDAEIIATLSYIKSTWPVEIREHHDAMR